MEAQVNLSAKYPLFSFVIPVYNRPDEMEELLESLCAQTWAHSFEVVVVEDGSQVDCRSVIDKYVDHLDILYKYVPNGGPSKARNIGANLAHGEYFIILDSDVVLPPTYLSEVYAALYAEGSTPSLDCYGGPDAALPTFKPIQKAINYAMTSFFTTGGIRGREGRKLDKFLPRSFNLGIQKNMFLRLGGFDEGMRFGEDIDFSLRVVETGAKVGLISKAYVYHKRRIDLKKFFKQVFNSGQARIELEKRHKGSMKIVHLFPFLFLAGSAILLLSSLICGYSLILLLLIALCFFFDSLRLGNGLEVSILAVCASFIQLWGYGLGFMVAGLRFIVGKGRSRTFDANFYE